MQATKSNAVNLAAKAENQVNSAVPGETTTRLLAAGYGWVHAAPGSWELEGPSKRVAGHVSPQSALSEPQVKVAPTSSKN